MTSRFKIICFPLLIFLGLSLFSEAQNPLQRLPGAGSFRGGGGGGGGDSLKHRTGNEDSITIVLRYLDTTRYRGFDSSISDFNKRLPLPSDYVHLGNLGTPAKSILFRPITAAGWDHGFHAYDAYQMKLEETRFFNTTRPFSELGYMLGSKAEQFIHLLHTQNITPDWNGAFEYQLINSPGLFKNQSTNHNSYRINSSYQSRNRRYHAYLVVLANKIQAGENGGITSDTSMADLVTYGKRQAVPVQLGNQVDHSGSMFSTDITTGTTYRNRTFFLRQQYDLGVKDSIVTDTTVIPLFYPKLRIEYNINYTSYQFAFADEHAKYAGGDSAYYENHYGYSVNPDTINLTDSWRTLLNDFSLYQFPDSKNPQQFVKAGVSFQLMNGKFDHSTEQYHNVIVHGEYRNKTRNRKWDVEINGQIYPKGYNAGDYNGLISLKRLISKSIGYLQAGFQNVNRTPSFIFNEVNSFNTVAYDYNKENIINIFGSLEQPRRNLRLSGHYYLISNYTYFHDFYIPGQAAALFNLLQVSAEKEFSLSKTIKWYAEVVLQQKTGNAPVNVPLIYTRNRIEYAGNLGFKNLDIHFGTELKYRTPYKADAYSPLLGQFFYQDTTTKALQLPHIDLYMHFRIKTFTAYLRLGNVNTMSFKNGFGWTNNNMEIPGYPYHGAQLRLGIFWSFIN